MSLGLEYQVQGLGYGVEEILKPQTLNLVQTHTNSKPQAHLKPKSPNALKSQTPEAQALGARIQTLGATDNASVLGCKVFFRV